MINKLLMCLADKFILALTAVDNEENYEVKSVSLLSRYLPEEPL
jgi:hypothetical protein